MVVSDGEPHDVYLEFIGHRGYISVDGQKVEFSSQSSSDRFNLHGQMYVGGLGEDVDHSLLPLELWSVLLGFSYVGCVQVSQGW